MLFKTTVRNGIMVSIATLVLSAGSVMAATSYTKLFADTLIVRNRAVVRGDLTVKGNLTTQSLSDVLGTDPTTWSAVVTDVWDNRVRQTTTLDGTDLTITFTPSDSTSGTFTTTPVNLFNPYEQIEAGSNIGEINGEYTIVGNHLLIAGATPAGSTTGSSVAVEINGDGTLVIDAQNSAPQAVIVLTPAS